MMKHSTISIRKGSRHFVPGANKLIRVNQLVLVILLSLALYLHNIVAQTTIGGLTTDPSSILDVQGNNKGVLFPRMDNTQRGNLSMPATGLMIFNTSTRCLEINLGSTTAPSWQAIKCPPPAAVTGLNCAGTVQTGYLQPAQAANGLSLSIPYTGGNGGSLFPTNHQLYRRNRVDREFIRWLD